MKTYISVIVLLIQCISAVNSQDFLYERDACKTINQESGICVRLELCPPAQEMLEKNLHPINCGFLKDSPIVCCPLNETKHTFVAKKRCDSFDLETSFIIHGVDASVKEFPHMAALGYNPENETVWLCGGSLISNFFVLTAAHCLNSLEYGPVQRVRLGARDIITPDYSENYDVIRRIKHPLYKPPLVYHDLGILELDRRVSINQFIQPACLYTEDIIPQEQKLLAAGWGITKVGGNQSKILQKVSLDLFTEEECNLSYNGGSSKRRLKHGILHKQQICAGGRKIGTDTCQGDSGGPMFFKTRNPEELLNKFHVVGVTSFGKSCGIVNVPGIYTRVSCYVPWIESIVWPNETSYW